MGHQVSKEQTNDLKAEHRGRNKLPEKIRDEDGPEIK